MIWRAYLASSNVIQNEEEKPFETYGFQNRGLATQQRPLPETPEDKDNDTFGGHIGKEPRLMNHTHANIRSKVGSRKTQHTHTCKNIQAYKREEGKIAETRRKYEKVIAWTVNVLL